MEGLSSRCSANQGHALGKSGFSKAAVARKQPGIPGDVVMPSMLSPPSQGTPGISSPSRRSGHEGWPGSPCWSHVPLARGRYCPQRCQETVPSSPSLSASLSFPF